jgi:hypothetical protein
MNEIDVTNDAPDFFAAHKDLHHLAMTMPRGVPCHPEQPEGSLCNQRDPSLRCSSFRMTGTKGCFFQDEGQGEGPRVLVEAVPRRDPGGWVYLDCLLGLLVLAMVFTPALLSIGMATRICNGESAAAEARDNAQAALGIIGRLIRGAGCNPKGISLQTIRFQGSTGLSLESDLSGDPDGLPDGFQDDPFERVSIQWDAANQQITLASGAGNRQPLARGITSLEMQGLDRYGVPTSIESEVVYVQVQIHSAGDSYQGFPMMAEDAPWSVCIPILSRLEALP